MRVQGDGSDEGWGQRGEQQELFIVHHYRACGDFNIYRVRNCGGCQQEPRPSETSKLQLDRPTGYNVGPAPRRDVTSKRSRPPEYRREMASGGHVGRPVRVY